MIFLKAFKFIKHLRLSAKVSNSWKVDPKLGIRNSDSEFLNCNIPEISQISYEIRIKKCSNLIEFELPNLIPSSENPLKGFCEKFVTIAWWNFVKKLSNIKDSPNVWDIVNDLFSISRRVSLWKTIQMKQCFHLDLSKLLQSVQRSI